MRFWIDIEDAGGLRFGPGPIVTATAWKNTRRLDRAGAFSFTMPAADPRAALVQPKRIARCWGVVNDAVTELGAGIIDQIRITLVDEQPMIEVSGDDLLRELTYRSVHGLEIADDLDPVPASYALFYDHSAGTYTNMTHAIDGNSLTGFSPDWSDSADRLFIGYSEKFNALHFTISAGNATAASLTAIYWDGDSWETLTISDGTAEGGASFAHAGDVTFTIPQDWSRSAVDGKTAYWICLALDAAIGSGTTFNEIEVGRRGIPSPYAIRRIMAYAPEGWNCRSVVKVYKEGTGYVAWDNTTDGNPQTYNETILRGVDYIIIGDQQPFERIEIDFISPNTNNVPTNVFAYFNGTTWISVSNYVDGTRVGNKTFAQSGVITFTLPSDWERTTIGGVEAYWGLISPIGDMSNIVVSEIRTYRENVDPVYARFAGESVLAALVKVAEAIGEHFRLGSGRRLEWLPEIENSGVRIMSGIDPIALDDVDSHVGAILDLEEEQDSYDLVTRVYPYGSGNGRARLTLAAATESAPSGYDLSTSDNYLRHIAAEAQYGRIERVLSFKEIAPISNTTADVAAAANALMMAAYNYLERVREPQRFYRLRTIIKRAIAVGETIRVIYRRVVDEYTAVDIDDDLVVLEAETEVDSDGVHTIALSVATVDRWNVGDGDLVAGQMEEGRVYEAHPQLNANSYVISWREEVDADHPAELRFWIGPEVTQVNQVLLRFRVDPLRSTIKSIAGTTTTTASGGGSTQTSTTFDTQHVHQIEIDDSTAGTAVTYSSARLKTSGGGTIQTTMTDLSHSHNVTMPAHTHNVDLSAAISSIYGVYEESDSDKILQESDLGYFLNGSDDLGDEVEAIGNGWYQIDLTDHLVDESLRPVMEMNTMMIATTVEGKAAEVRAQLLVRSIIQAIALV